MTPMMIIYFCQGWTGWLYVTWMPSLLKNNYGLDLKKSSLLYAAVILAGFIAELLGGVGTDYLLRRTESVQIARARLIAVVWVLAVAALVPAILVHNLVVGVAGFTLTLFFMGMAGAPLWAAAIDIAPNYAGSSTALMNGAGAVAGIMSPVVFGWVPDADRQLDGSVRRLRRTVIVRRRRDLVEPAGPPDRGCSVHRQFGCGGRIEPISQIGVPMSFVPQYTLSYSGQGSAPGMRASSR